jgi:hypothetical protein
VRVRVRVSVRVRVRVIIGIRGMVRVCDGCPKEIKCRGVVLSRNRLGLVLVLGLG